MNNNLIKTSLLSAVGTLAYIAIVVTIMSNAERWFDGMPKFLGPMAFLLLFVVSAAITSSLVLGKPLMMFLDGAKKQAIKLFGCTVGWLAIALVIVFVVLALI